MEVHGQFSGHLWVELQESSMCYETVLEVVGGRKLAAESAVDAPEDSAGGLRGSKKPTDTHGQETHTCSCAHRFINNFK